MSHSTISMLSLTFRLQSQSAMLTIPIENHILVFFLTAITWHKLYDLIIIIYSYFNFEKYACHNNFSAE